MIPVDMGVTYGPRLTFEHGNFKSLGKAEIQP
jgi:hypothetical protein